MRWLLHILLPILAIFLQSTFFSSYSIKGAVPDLLLLLVIFFSLLGPRKQAPLYGFCCGLFEDLYMGRFIGLNAISKAITAFLLSHLQQNVFKENILVGMMAVFIGTVLNSGMVLLLSLFKFNGIHWDDSLFMTIIFQTLYNALLSGPLYIWYYNSSHYGVLRETEVR